MMIFPNRMMMTSNYDGEDVNNLVGSLFLMKSMNFFITISGSQAPLWISSINLMVMMMMMMMRMRMMTRYPKKLQYRYLWIMNVWVGVTRKLVWEAFSTSTETQ